MKCDDNTIKKKTRKSCMWLLGISYPCVPFPCTHVAQSYAVPLQLKKLKTVQN